MNHIQIDGVKYPFKITINALIKYESEFNKSISEVNDTMLINEVVALVYYGLEAGAKLEKKELEISRDFIGDVVPMQELTQIVAIAFQDIAGKEVAGDKEEKKEKPLKE